MLISNISSLVTKKPFAKLGTHISTYLRSFAGVSLRSAGAVRLAGASGFTALDIFELGIETLFLVGVGSGCGLFVGDVDGLKPRPWIIL